MPWQVTLSKRAEQALHVVEPSVREAAMRAIDRLAATDNPRTLGKMLSGLFRGTYRVRVRKNWRLLYSVSEQTKTIEVFAFGHRASVYDGP